VYPAGHNLVIYNLDDKTQTFLSGFEGTNAITCMSLSPSRRYLAVCEEAERAVAFVFDLQTGRRRKPLTTFEVLTK
jgi:hypothetical protein